MFRRLSLTFASLCLAAAACGSSNNETSTAEPSASAGDSASSDAGASDALVPELTGEFATISGGQIELNSLEGQDVVLWFWAPW